VDVGTRQETCNYTPLGAMPVFGSKPTKIIRPILNFIHSVSWVCLLGRHTQHSLVHTVALMRQSTYGLQYNTLIHDATAHKAVYYCNYPTAPNPNPYPDRSEAQGQDTSQWDLFKPLCALRSVQCNGWGIFNMTKAPTIDRLIDYGQWYSTKQYVTYLV
jgi:hypothetical protein